MILIFLLYKCQLLHDRYELYQWWVIQKVTSNLNAFYNNKKKYFDRMNLFELNVANEIIKLSDNYTKKVSIKNNYLIDTYMFFFIISVYILINFCDLLVKIFITPLLLN